MKITESTLDFSTKHLFTQEKKVEESLTIVRRGLNSQTAEQLPSANALPNPVQISDAGRQNLQAETASGAKSINKQVENNPQLTLLQQVIETFTGEKINLSHVDLRDPKEAVSMGMVYQRHSSYTETEATDFSAQGMVRTADGREISFTLELSMFRFYHEEEHIETRMGAALEDPLVINFAGTAAELSDMTFKFDLQANGQDVNMRALKSGSGYLVFDRNGDGKVNDGSELFGALTGDGFKELAALDDDGNGWIDENDEAFSNLYIWNKDASGNDVMTRLKDAGIGAIALKYINTQFSLKDTNNNLLGQIRSSGIFLNENGSVGSVQKIDIAV